MAAITRKNGDSLMRAQRPLENVLAEQRRTLGSDHPDTLDTMDELADELRTSGDPPGRLKLLEEVATTRERLQGPNAPTTLRALHRLADAVARSGDMRRAQEIEENVVEASERT